jgi:hypothetical protein
VRSEEVKIRSGRRESELVNRACVGKSSLLALSIVEIVHRPRKDRRC